MILLKLLYFYIPVAIANTAPVLIKNHFKFLAVPIDKNKIWKGKEIFGSHKTWRGLIFATLCGGFVYLIQYYLAYKYPSFNNLPFDYFQAPMYFGFLFAASAIIGDLIKSFVKRRFNIKPGKSWFPFDQIDWVFGSLIFAVFYINIEIKIIAVSILLFGLLHPIINLIGYYLGIKKNKF